MVCSLSFLRSQLIANWYSLALIAPVWRAHNESPFARSFVVTGLAHTRQIGYFEVFAGFSAALFSILPRDPIANERYTGNGGEKPSFVLVSAFSGTLYLFGGLPPLRPLFPFFLNLHTVIDRMFSFSISASFFLD